MFRVTSWKALRPSSVKPKVTFGSWLGPNSCFGPVISVPDSAGLSFSAYQPGEAPSIVSPLEFWGSSETIVVPWGTLTTIPTLWGRFFPVGATYRSSLENSGPAIVLWGFFFSKRK